MEELTVKDLIEHLTHYPSDMPVKIWVFDIRTEEDYLAPVVSTEFDTQNNAIVLGTDED